MFRFVVSLFMLCSLGVHTVLGCCWHHAHAEHGHETPSASRTKVSRHIHIGSPCHHHPHQPAETSDAEEPRNPPECPHDTCCEELTCSYLTSAPSKLPLPESHPYEGMPRLIGMMDFPAGSLGQVHGRSREDAPPLAGRFAVRDLTQVWLL